MQELPSQHLVMCFNLGGGAFASSTFFLLVANLAGRLRAPMSGQHLSCAGMPLRDRAIVPGQRTNHTPSRLPRQGSQRRRRDFWSALPDAGEVSL